MGGEPEGVAQSPDERWVAVTSEEDNVVTWIDLTTRTATGETATEMRPRHVEFTTDGRQLWIAAEIGGVVQIADVASRTITDTLRFEIEGVAAHRILPCGIRFTPDGRTAIVALVDVASRKVRAYVPVGRRVWHVAVSADGRHAYSANGLSDNVSVIDLDMAKVVGTVPVGSAPWGIAIAP